MELKPTRVPLRELHVSKHNARFGQTHDPLAIANLADSISAVGLLHPLVVHPDPDGGFGVVAGSRRLAALLVVHGEAPASIPVMLIDDPDSNALALASLAENGQREAMTDAQMLQAIGIMHTDGRTPPTVGEMADALGTSETRVRRLSRLATVAQPILKAFYAGKLELDELTEFARSPDQAAQLEVWELYQSDGIGLWQIKKAFGFGRDDLAAQLKYVGEEAYQAAGGFVERDLFADSDSFKISDPALLQKLLFDKTAPAREALQAMRDVPITFAFERPLTDGQFDYSLRAHSRYPDDVRQQIADAEAAQRAALDAASTVIGERIYHWSMEKHLEQSADDRGLTGDKAAEWEQHRAEALRLDDEITELQESPQIVSPHATLCVLSVDRDGVTLTNEWWFPDRAALGKEQTDSGKPDTATPPPPQPKPGEPDYDPDSPALTQRAVDYIKGMRSRIAARVLINPLSEVSNTAAANAHKALIFALGWKLATSEYSVPAGFVHGFAGDSFAFAGSPLGRIDPPKVPGLNHKDAAKGFALFAKKATPLEVDLLAAWVFAAKLQPEIAHDPATIPGAVLADLDTSHRARDCASPELTADFFNLFTKKVLAGFGATVDEKLGKDILAAKGEEPVKLITNAIGKAELGTPAGDWLPTFLRWPRK